MNNYFQNIVCLSLKDRTDRRKQATEELGNQGINFEFFNAIPGGFSGFNMSQKLIFGQYKNKGSLLVFEDDVEFLHPWEDVSKSLEELPDDWDMIYFGANVRQPIERHSDHLLRLKNAWTSHAIGYSEKMVTYLSKNWSGKYTTPFVYDEWLRVYIQPKFNVFITDPMYCTQRRSFSDLMKTVSNYDIIQRSQKYYAPIERKI